VSRFSEVGKHPKFPLPGPDSPFFVTPVSDKALRWYVVVLLIGPAVLLAAIVAAMLTEQWLLLLFVLVLLCCYSAMRWFQIRAVARELSVRRTARCNLQ
jgi:hypothetical protein